MNNKLSKKPKDEVRKEKINFMERTYSLTPYKRKRSSNNVSAIENQNYAMVEYYFIMIFLT